MEVRLLGLDEKWVLLDVVEDDPFEVSDSAWILGTCCDVNHIKVRFLLIGGIYCLN